MTIVVRAALYLVSAGVLALVPSAYAQGAEPYEQEFVITAYYSPVEGQCCYVKGGETADKILNGQGISGADGTGVYPGMIAAPSSYAFGTRIELPGIGIGTVHDRGGAIVEQGEKHRLDIWVGYGEEGLARALAFGVQRVRGTVYPLGSEMPADNMNIKSFASPLERIVPFQTSHSLLDLSIEKGDYSYSVVLLQEALRDIGVFDHAITGVYGDVTEESVRTFQAMIGLNESTDSIGTTLAAYLEASRTLRGGEERIPLANAESGVSTLQKAQRLLRFLGYYRGRTNGQYDDNLADAIFRFQYDHQLVGAKDMPGAGVIGPLTRAALFNVWNKSRIEDRANILIARQEIRNHLIASALVPTRTMHEGWTGNEVQTLQALLAREGYFPHEEMNGVFGPMTRDALLQYQLDRGIVTSGAQVGAGTLGPQTLKSVQETAMRQAYNSVRAGGWEAL